MRSAEASFETSAPNGDRRLITIIGAAGAARRGGRGAFPWITSDDA
jgi:hypothetical protein